DSEFCADCYADLPWNNPACVRCALPLATQYSTTCPACARRLPAFDRSIAAVRYEFPVDVLVRRFKYNGMLHLAPSLSKLLLDAVLLANLEKPEALLPVPLHTARLKERGFNQSIEIARILSRAMDIPLLTTAIRRQRDTPFQTGLVASQRRKNLRNAFVATTTHLPESVAIVDDVMTTGTTAQAIASLLRNHGVKHMTVWAISRAD
ncbi:MAG: ComF family protein, partial [Gammaproteobacteria bacterium]